MEKGVCRGTVWGNGGGGFIGKGFGFGSVGVM